MVKKLGCCLLVLRVFPAALFAAGDQTCTATVEEIACCQGTCLPGVSCPCDFGEIPIIAVGGNDGADTNLDERNLNIQPESRFSPIRSRYGLAELAGSELS